MSTQTDIDIRQMSEADIAYIVETFKAWNKTEEQYTQYFEELKKGTRDILVAWSDTHVVGYVTILWEPRYDIYKKEQIPEIVDLNVIVSFQRKGIGSRLIKAAEELAQAKGHKRVGISVEQTPDYEPPRNLYQKLGYIFTSVNLETPTLHHLVKSIT